ncbi:MAG: HlyD family efflux transporter periplasmic adaptor subunit [bacterium]
MSTITHNLTTFKHFFYSAQTSVRAFVRAHKAWSAVITLAALWCVWLVWSMLTSTSGQVRYVLGTVQTGTVISTVSASGQVTANQNLTITPKVSGQVTYVGVTPGQSVSAGTLIAEIDSTDAQRTVRNAQASLDSTTLSLVKLQQPATALTITQQQNAIDQAKQSLTAQYQNSFNDVTSTFLDLPTIISGVQDTDLGSEASSGQWNIDYYKNQAAAYNPNAATYRDAAYNDYMTARTSYDKTFADFQAVSSTPDQVTIEKLLVEVHNTVGTIATAVKSANSLIQLYSDAVTQNNGTPKPIAVTQIANLNSYLNKAQTHLTALLNDTNTLATDKQNITEKQQTLDQTNQGANTLDLQSAQLAVTQQENALQDAKDTLAEYYLYAPFGGVVASVPVHKYDQASSGTTLATLITTAQFADLSLNEVDASKVSLGEKATLTFDAIPDLTLTGTVAQISPVGTVTQGVVSYDVKIGFDSQDSRIKSGMTANASIQTAVHQNVLIVPQSAVKTQGGASYVQAFTPPLVATSTTPATPSAQGVVTTQTPVHVSVQTGISDTNNIEVTSGLTEGQQVIVRTITGTATTPTTSSAPSILGNTGGARGGAGGGGGGRIGG